MPVSTFPAPILVTGDWEVASTDGGITTFRHVFECEAFTRWGAGVEPRVTLPVLRAIVASQQARIDATGSGADCTVWDRLGLTSDPDAPVLAMVGKDQTEVVEPQRDPDSGVLTWNVGLGWTWGIFEHDPEVNRAERIVRSDGTVDHGIRITETGPCHDSPGTTYTFTYGGAGYTVDDWSNSNSGGFDVYDENGLPASLFDEHDEDEDGRDPLRQAVDAYEERLTAAYARLGITGLIDQAQREALA